MILKLKLLLARVWPVSLKRFKEYQWKNKKEQQELIDLIKKNNMAIQELKEIKKEQSYILQEINKWKNTQETLEKKSCQEQNDIISELNHIKKEVQNQKIRIDDVNSKIQYYFVHSLSSEQYEDALKEWYYSYTGTRLDLKNPKTFNEKIQWMKLYDKNPLRTTLSDKYAVREWVKSKIGEQYLIPLLGVWNDFDEVDFTTLPERFVLKANHGSGWNIIVKDKTKFNIDSARTKFRLWLSQNYAYKGYEFQYKDIEPKIIAEQYIENEGDLYDYKFLCLNREPRFVWVDTQRYAEHKRTIFDMDWKEQPFNIMYEHSNVPIPKPENFDEMKRIVKCLCADFPLVRVDLYYVQEKIYFGEMTFTSGNGKEKFEPEEFNRFLGDMVTLSNY